MSSIAPFHVRLCLKYETAAVLVVTQHRLLKHMQWEDEMTGVDVWEPDMLKAVQTAVRVNRSVKRIRIKDQKLRCTNVATAIIEGAAHNITLMEVELETPDDDDPPLQLQEVVDKTRQANPKLRLFVRAGE